MASDQQPPKGINRFWKLIAVAVVAVFVASILYYTVGPGEHAGGDFDLSYNYRTRWNSTGNAPPEPANFSASFHLKGSVSNHGLRDGKATLYVNIADVRVYNVSDTLDLGRVHAFGGRVIVNETYDWPDYYNGVSSLVLAQFTITAHLVMTDL